MKLVHQFFLVQIIFLIHTVCALAAQPTRVDNQRYKLFAQGVAEEFKDSKLGRAAATSLNNNTPQGKLTEAETAFFPALDALGLHMNDIACISPEEAQALIEKKTYSGSSKNRIQRQQAQVTVLQYFDYPEIQYMRRLIQQFPEQVKKLQSLNQQAVNTADLRERVRLLRASKR